MTDKSKRIYADGEVVKGFFENDEFKGENNPMKH